MVPGGQPEETAEVEEAAAHLVIADGRPHRGLFHDLRIDVEERALPLGVGPLEVGVVAEQQEEVYALAAGAGGVVAEEALLDLRRLAGMGELSGGVPLRLGTGIADHPDVEVAVLRGLVAVGRRAEHLLGAARARPGVAQAVVVVVIGREVAEKPFVVVAGRRSRRNALGPVALAQVLEALGPADPIRPAAPLHDRGLGSHLLEHQSARRLGRARSGEQARRSQPHRESQVSPHRYALPRRRRDASTRVKHDFVQ